MSGIVNEGMDEGSMMESEDRIQKMVDIYVNAEAVRDMKLKRKTDMSDAQTPQHKENDSATVRSSRAAPVCLVLLYFLLLTAVIVLSVLIYTNNTNYTHERNQLLTRITNITEKHDQLLTRNNNLTEERDELLTRNTNLTEWNNQLLTGNTNLTERNDQLLTRNTNLTDERNKLKIKNGNLINVTNQLNYTLQIVDGWIYNEFSFYFVPNDTGKNWSESRRDCQRRGADLVIINNREEQDFVMNFTRGKECWIGLTDVEVEGRWKWVDGTNMTIPFWGSNAQFKEPNGGTKENCVVSFYKPVPDILGWLDVPCGVLYQWICEKSIFLP